MGCWLELALFWVIKLSYGMLCSWLLVCKVSAWHMRLSDGESKPGLLGCRAISSSSHWNQEGKRGPARLQEAQRMTRAT